MSSHLSWYCSLPYFNTISIQSKTSLGLPGVIRTRKMISYLYSLSVLPVASRVQREGGVTKVNQLKITTCTSRATQHVSWWRWKVTRLLSSRMFTVLSRIWKKALAFSISKWQASHWLSQSEPSVLSEAWLLPLKFSFFMPITSTGTFAVVIKAVLCPRPRDPLGVLWMLQPVRGQDFMKPLLSPDSAFFPPTCRIFPSWITQLYSFCESQLPHKDF